MRFLNLIIRNWKKSAVGLCAVGYGVRALHDHIEIKNHMRKICNDVLTESSACASPKSVVVVLNPVSNKKKSEKMFKKYCEPLLHLAGCRVQLLHTAGIGHAKSLIESLPNLPDAIVIAGGDGTYSEVVTGLLRRREHNCPIALVPLGRTNKTVYKWLSNEPKNSLGYLTQLSNSLIPLVKGKSEYESVIKFDVIAQDPQSSTSQDFKPVFGLNEFSWGVIRDIEIMRDKYWYFGNLSFYIASLLHSYSEKLNWDFSTVLAYSPPCAGCSNCVTDNKLQVRSSFLKKLLSHKINDDLQSKHELINDLCKTVSQGSIETSQLNITCQRNETFFELETRALKKLSPGIDFIKYLFSESLNPEIVLKSRTIELHPSVYRANTFYSIDGEEYDVRPVKISLIQNAIKVFR